MVQQFFATLVLGPEENTSMTWMTGPVKCISSFEKFGQVLGFVFKGDTVSVGRKMHVEGVDYDKKKLAPLVSKEGALATSKGLKPIYNILIRMFRESIAPKPVIRMLSVEHLSTLCIMPIQHILPDLIAKGMRLM